MSSYRDIPADKKLLDVDAQEHALAHQTSSEGDVRRDAVHEQTEYHRGYASPPNSHKDRGLDRLLISQVWKRPSLYWPFFIDSLKGRVKEQAKPVLYRPEWWDSALYILCHMIPIGATIVLAVLNLKGYYIGSELQGQKGETWTALDVLTLQTTAKALEILTGISLGFVVMDLVRHGLMKNETGLPFMLLGAKLRYTDPTYLLSPSFLLSSRGMPQLSRKVFVYGMLILCGAIVILSGPSSAVLMIPVVKDAWPAGGTTLWLKGSADVLWPDVPTADSAGGLSCPNPTATMLQSNSANASGCAWGGWTALREYFFDQRLSRTASSNLTVYDGIIDRIFRTYLNRKNNVNVGHHVVGPSVGPSLMSVQVSGVWNTARFTPQARSFWNAYLWNSRDEKNIFTVESYIPVVRTKCNIATHIDFFNWNTEGTPFPLLPEYGAYDGVSYSFKYHPVNSSDIATQWIPTPSSNVTLVDSEFKVVGTTSQFPSGFLLVQIPYLDAWSQKVVLTCTVDARWAMGANVFSESNSPPAGVIMNKREATEGEDMNNFLPVDDGTWRTVRPNSDWLNALTPSINGSGYTTMASIARAMGLQNDTGLVWLFDSDTTESMEIATSNVVADGMSRIGYFDQLSQFGHIVLTTTNIQDLNLYGCRSVEQCPPALHNVLGRFFTHNGDVFPPPQVTPADNFTGKPWNATVSGWAYKADSAASYLALVVMFLHAVVVIGHTIYLFSGQRDVIHWGSFDEIVALARVSGRAGSAPVVLQNTSSGIESSETLRKRVKVRAIRKEAWQPGEEHLQLVFEGEDEERFEHVKRDENYGSED